MINNNSDFIICVNCNKIQKHTYNDSTVAINKKRLDIISD